MDAHPDVVWHMYTRLKRSKSHVSDPGGYPLSPVAFNVITDYLLRRRVHLTGAVSAGEQAAYMRWRQNWFVDAKRVMPPWALQSAMTLGRALELKGLL